MSAITIVKDKAKAATVKVKEVVKNMSLGDWGSLASICGVGLFFWDQQRKKKR